MTFESFLPLLLSFLVGAVLGAAVAFLLRAGKGQKQLLEATGELSAARAAAELEESRREELEGGATSSVNAATSHQASLSALNCTVCREMCKKGGCASRSSIAPRTFARAVRRLLRAEASG